MESTPSHPLSETALREAFIDQLCILYNAKVHLQASIPTLAENATFRNLKLALLEDLEDTDRQMKSLKEIFQMMNVSWKVNSCLAMNSFMDEAHGQVGNSDEKHYDSNMSILFYMSTVENLQVGAMKILNLIARKIAYHHYAQLVRECLDVVEENASLFHYVAEEYLQ